MAALSRDWFQSLKGFQRLWISKYSVSLQSMILFQSLKGFQRLWIRNPSVTTIEKPLFQSLKGFQRLWIFLKRTDRPVKPTVVSIPKRVSEALNQFIDCFRLPDLSVSIPKRVSEALNLKRYAKPIKNSDVSIPKRVSEALNHQKNQNLELFFAKFQSLKGFQRLWILPVDTNSTAERVISFNP